MSEDKFGFGLGCPTTRLRRDYHHNQDPRVGDWISKVIVVLLRQVYHDGMFFDSSVGGRLHLGFDLSRSGAPSETSVEYLKVNAIDVWYPTLHCKAGGDGNCCDVGVAELLHLLIPHDGGPTGVHGAARTAPAKVPAPNTEAVAPYRINPPARREEIVYPILHEGWGSITGTRQFIPRIDVNAGSRPGGAGGRPLLCPPPGTPRGGHVLWQTFSKEAKGGRGPRTADIQKACPSETPLSWGD